MTRHLTSNVATLMLVAHVEQEGVWLVEGGMARLADALARLAERHGAVFRYGAEVERIDATGGRASSVTLATGERIEAAFGRKLSGRLRFFGSGW